MLLRCLDCGHEWEKVARDLIRCDGRGCKPCSHDARRKPNEVVSEVGNVLVLNVSNAKWPNGTMLIYKKKWEILQREKIGRVWLCPKGYAKANWMGKPEFVHRILMGFPQAPEQVDHINGIRHDNRMSNLRIVTALENQMNRGLRKTNTSGIPGVSWCSRFKKWVAELRVNRKRVHRSRHKTLEEAAAARAKAVQEHCGEFAPQKVEKKPPLTNAELDGIYQMLCREGGRLDGGPQSYEGRPVYPMWSTAPEEVERLLCDP